MKSAHFPLLGQLDAKVPASLVDADIVDDAVGAGEVDMLEYARIVTDAENLATQGIFTRSKDHGLAWTDVFDVAISKNFESDIFGGARPFHGSISRNSFSHQ